MKLGKGYLHAGLAVILAICMAPAVIGCSSSCSDHRVARSEGIETDKLYNEVALPSYKVLAGNWSGSAVAIKPRLLITAAHVVLSDGGNPMQDIKIFSRIGKHTVICDAKVIKFRRAQDIALLETNVDLPYTAQLIAREEIYEAVLWGSAVAASGYALGVDDPVVTEGRITSLDTYGFMMYNCLTVFGNSGGPVYARSNGVWKVVSICQQVFTAGGPVCHMGLGMNTWSLLDFVYPPKENE